MGAVYTIELQQPRTYIDQGVPVSGYLVQARLHDFNEIVQVNVPQLDAALIDAKIQELIEQRKKLAQLGS